MICLKVEFLVKEGTENRTRELIRILEEQSRKEPGCRAYVGYQSVKDSRRFFLYEVYANEAALQAHRDAAYFKQYVTRGLNDVIEKRVRRLYKPISDSVPSSG
jgi:(4S)-4-hydroxy-5-phosphonooxypentane-2,3-dione isomerase